MRRARRAYYDWFSRFYDGFVALHSRDKQGLARKFLVDRLPIQNGGVVLDLCTGTATLLPLLQAKVGREGQVVGVDFSPGMLKVAQEKTRSLANIYLVEADDGHEFGHQEQAESMSIEKVLRSADTRVGFHRKTA